MDAITLKSQEKEINTNYTINDATLTMGKN